MKIPAVMDPLASAKSRREVTGVMAVQTMPRLQPVLLSSEQLATVHLQFGVDDNQRVIMTLHIAVTLQLACQRCFQAMAYPCDISVILCPVATTTEAEALPEAYEPWLMTEAGFKPAQAVEEELLLNLPLAPMHADDDCAQSSLRAYYAPSKQKVPTHQPFKVLAGLKQKK